MRGVTPFLFYVLLLAAPLLFDYIAVVRLVTILSYAYIMSIFALSFSILLSYLGLLNFGHALFFGFGAYMTAYQLLWLGVPYPIAIIISALIGSLLGIAVAFVTRKAFRGIPFAFITLTVQLIVYFLYRRRELRFISGSEQGLLIPLPEIFANVFIPLISVIVISILITECIYDLKREFSENLANNRSRYIYLLWIISLSIIYVIILHTIMLMLSSRSGPYRVSFNLYVMSLTLLFIVYMFLKKILNTNLALVWIAIRDIEVRAETMGYNTFKLKAYALALTGFVAALSGGLYIIYSQTINPDTAFSPLVSVYGLIYSVVGGLYLIEGSIVGALTVTIIERYLTDFLGGWNVVITGILFITIIIFLPRGVSYYSWIIWRTMWQKLSILVLGKKFEKAYAVKRNS